MSHNIPIDVAGTQLGGLVRALGPHDEIILTDNDKPVARIVPNANVSQRIAGKCKGFITILQDDDEHLEDFKEYMP